ncbi:MAG: 50S ribosomal protein L3 [Candidatus Sericytochromatia bacterium]|nr:50S ribosomal protein L3 [Candidatus Sericytochromatia bacterium]
MSIGILGKKVGMTQVYDSKGVLHPVTVIQAGPCTVTQVKNNDSDGYSAIQIGYNEVKPHRLSKPELGHLTKNNLKAVTHLKEFRLEESELKKIGDILDVTVFNEGDAVDVTGKSIGKGFVGTVARYNFARGPMSHGSKNHRAPGSIGAGTGLSRVLKGKKMAGRVGAKRVTVKNLSVIKVDKERNLILVRGSIPGAEGGLLVIQPAVRVGK